MTGFLINELLNFAIMSIITVYSIMMCSCNDRTREQIHIQRRQALRNRQREAAVSGRSVRSVIETEAIDDDASCPRFTCVRMTPRLKNSDTADVYSRLNKSDGEIPRIAKEKPPSISDFDIARASYRGSHSRESGSNEIVEKSDEKDKRSSAEAIDMDIAGCHS
ncbi:unnamed protein product [Caenorhabditis bovis]|uniref:Uncharacterized protein n=1 Tax=Caenorhabditis bovis TaxID=2654633 RepID=A0A8S1EA90_9PELO|nr:unnamed protein product [Caenorhabditis bovis]